MNPPSPTSTDTPPSPPLTAEQVSHAQATAEVALGEASLKQLSFKPGVCRDVAVAIVATILVDRIRWADEFDFAFVQPTDRNVIGTTWKRLATIGIVERLDLHRRSTAGSAKGRVVWKYHLKSAALAKTFLDRNGHYVPEPNQAELFPGVNGGTATL